VLAGRWGGPTPSGSLVAAAALPWLALVGAPRREARAGLALGLVLPTLALAAALEYQAGRAPAVLGPELAGAALLCLGLAASSAVGRPARDLAWLGLGVALPICAAVLAWNDGPGGGVEWLNTAARVSPLAWAADRAGPGANPGWTDLLAPAALTALLLGAARRGDA